MHFILVSQTKLQTKDVNKVGENVECPKVLKCIKIQKEAISFKSAIKWHKHA